MDVIKKILVAYDGSAEADRAYLFGLDLAQKYAAEVIVLAVACLPEPPGSIQREAVLEHATQYYEALFESLRQKGKPFPGRLRFEVRLGHPAEQIISFAQDESADMILLGHRGQSMLQRWMLGSVAKRVLNHAICTVVVVR